MGTPLPRYDKYGREMYPGPPWLPYAQPAPHECEPSELVKRVYERMEYPPLFSKKSCTRSVPFKDVYEYYKPSETIGKRFINLS